MHTRYIPSSELGDRACIVVDGAPRQGALITLSHWPRSGTPRMLKDDLSTQIAFRYIDHPEFHVAVEGASSDHFDEDGLASLFAITQPDEASGRRQRLCDLASAGDFGTYRTREAAQCAFVVSAYADPERSPLGANFFLQPEAVRVAGLYVELLGHLPALLDHPERYAHLWREEESILTAGEHAIQSGAIRIEDIPSLDLAIVTLPSETKPARIHRFAQVRNVDCHPMAIYKATPRLRILYMRGRSYELEYRYESWVQYMSHRPLPRVDLTPLAERLTRDESALSPGQESGTWAFDGVSGLTPRLCLVGAGESRIAPERFRSTLERFLEAAPPAWDPYSDGLPI